MHDNKPDQFVEELLEATLKRYGGEEPRAGLEMRVLAGIRSRQAAAQRRWLVWALALCAGVLAAIVLVLQSAHAPSRQRVTSASVPQWTANPSDNAGSVDLRLGSPRLVHEPKEKTRTPKPGVRANRRPERFPSPSPITEQERLLSSYLSRGSALDWMAETDKVDGAPITDLEVSPITVAPLEVKPLEDSQSKEGK